MGIFDAIGNSYGDSIMGAADNYIGGDGLSNLDTSWLSGAGDSLASSGSGFNFGSLPWGTIASTLGRLGSGIGAGVSAYQAGQQPNYMFKTNWLGNGLAATGLINNMQNRQNQMDQAFGTGNMLSSLFGKGFSLFGNGGYDKLSNNLGDYTITGDNIYNDDLSSIYGNNNGIIQKTITDYVRK